MCKNGSEREEVCKKTKEGEREREVFVCVCVGGWVREDVCVSWCFKSNQPQRIKSRLKTNYLSLNYTAYKS